MTSFFIRVLLLILVVVLAYVITNEFARERLAFLVALVVLVLGALALLADRGDLRR